MPLQNLSRIQRLAVILVALLGGTSAEPRAAGAQAKQCRVIEVQMTPSANLQIVVWLEDAAGNYVDTVFLTELTGTYGLGNRPGMMEFNSGYRWPYGRRTTTFPVWAHRHGRSWPLLVFQDHLPDEALNYNPGDAKTSADENLSHPLSHSSRETYYCRPLRPDEPNWDAQTCASRVAIYTDKGLPHATETSLYPPRSDLEYDANTDHSAVQEFATMNPFDAVSRATPPGGESFSTSWAIPRELPEGDYALWVEVSKEQDTNPHYDYPEPVGIPWREYGVSFRGQPSVLWRVPLRIVGNQTQVQRVTEWTGYGDPEGLDGDIRDPDPTITTNLSGSGASRLMLVSEAGEMHRIKVVTRAEDDTLAPAAVEGLAVTDISPTTVSLTFTNSGDDGRSGQVKGYELRYLAGKPVTEENFKDAVLVSSVPSDQAGLLSTVEVRDLVPRTHYFFAIQPFDECLNRGPMRRVEAQTLLPRGEKVDACFVATAAYGSKMVRQVVGLRQFRDRYLRTHVTGELLVEAYYTFGPALARVIAPSSLLRQFARTALAPVAEWANVLLSRVARQ